MQNGSGLALPRKRTGTAWRLSALLLLAASPAAPAQDYTYTTNSGKITITRYVGAGGEVDIPGLIEGLPVASLANKAFYTNTSVTRVAIPDSVTTIGQQAFYRCPSLAHAALGTGVTSIGTSAFYGCLQLTTIALPDSVVAFGNSTFSDCYSLTNATMGDGVTRIGDDAFEACSNLVRVELSTNITSIGDDAFRECRRLAGIEIPGQLTNLGESAFFNCLSLPSAAIPASVTFIGSNAFGSCKSLGAITVDALNPVYSSSNGILFNKDVTTLRRCPGAFGGGYSVPSGVTQIEAYAFSGCGALTAVVVCASVAAIGDVAFLDCTNLAAIVVDGGNPCFSGLNGALYDKSGDTLIQCPGAALAFVLPDNVTGIVRSAFYRCDRLATIGVAAGNTSFSSEDGVLFNLDQTRLIQCPGGRAGSYSIPASVTTVGATAFVGCYSLGSVAMSTNVRNVENDAFSACTSLTNALLGDNITNLGAEAFFSCTNLPSIVIPAGVANIASYAFGYCPRLTGVYCMGDEPDSGAFVFLGTTNSTVYYLPWTSGWGDTWEGRPATWWRPEVRHDEHFGVQDRQFGFSISWVTGRVVVVEVSPDISTLDWVPVWSNTLPGGVAHFSDAECTNHPNRFYRARWP